MQNYNYNDVPLSKTPYSGSPQLQKYGFIFYLKLIINNFKTKNMPILDYKYLYTNEYHSKVNKVWNLFTKFRLLKIRLLLFLFGIKISKSKFTWLIFKQVEKGYQKYGQTIIECDKNKYDWNIMACEEIIDFYLYSLKNKGKI